MNGLSVGDRVRITPSEEGICPWEGKPIGVIMSLDKDGTVAVEVEGDEIFGHQCLSSSEDIEPTENGWWFMPEELEVIK